MNKINTRYDFDKIKSGQILELVGTEWVWQNISSDEKIIGKIQKYEMSTLCVEIYIAVLDKNNAIRYTYSTDCHHTTDTHIRWKHGQKWKVAYFEDDILSGTIRDSIEDPDSTVDIYGTDLKFIDGW